MLSLHINNNKVTEWDRLLYVLSGVKEDNLRQINNWTIVSNILFPFLIKFDRISTSA